MLKIIMTHILPGFKNEPQSEYHFFFKYFSSMCRLNDGLHVASYRFELRDGSAPWLLPN